MVKCLCATDSSPQSIVVCVRCQSATQRIVLAGLQRKGTSLVLDDGIEGVATVTVADSVYFIATSAREQRLDNAKRKWTAVMKKVTCANLMKLSQLASVEWVRPLDRSLQRILGLGDVYATRGDIEKAVGDDNTNELLTLMPNAAALLDREQTLVLPALHDALEAEGLPALADCRHQFSTENMFTPAVDGPCGVCGVTAEQQIGKRGFKDFTECKVCNSVRCKPCALEVHKAQNDQTNLLRAYHEATKTHVWEKPEVKCDACGGGVRGGGPFTQCDCGQLRCDACIGTCPCAPCDLCGELATASCACGEHRCDACAHTCGWELPAADGTECSLCGSKLGVDPLLACACGRSRCWNCI